MSIESREKLLTEIGLFIEYTVPENDISLAKSLVERYRDNFLVLRLLREHYSILPGDQEEAVKRVALLMSKSGNYLYVVSSDSFTSLYLVSVDTIVWLGEYGKEVDTQILDYFDFVSQKEFRTACKSIEELQEPAGEAAIEIAHCPACKVAEGENHLLGCVIEVCPWCEGQLSVCNCRFDQLKTDEIVDDEQLEEFYDRLSAKGRIAFIKDHAPAYPGTSDGLDRDENSS